MGESKPKCPTCGTSISTFHQRTRFQVAAGELLTAAEKLQASIEEEDRAAWHYAFPEAPVQEGHTYGAETSDDDYWGLASAAEYIIERAQKIKDAATLAMGAIYLDQNGQYGAITLRFPQGVTDEARLKEITHADS